VKQEENSALERAEFRVVYEERPDPVWLDTMMPSIGGWQMSQRLRDLSEVPMIVLTAKAGEKDELKESELAADDYVTQAFSLRGHWPHPRRAPRGAPRVGVSR
jgi:DNA-binding response OmpR family regulator